MTHIPPMMLVSKWGRMLSPQPEDLNPKASSWVDKAFGWSNASKNLIVWQLLCLWYYLEQTHECKNSKELINVEQNPIIGICHYGTSLCITWITTTSQRRHTRHEIDIVNNVRCPCEEGFHHINQRTYIPKSTCRLEKILMQVLPHKSNLSHN